MHLCMYVCVHTCARTHTHATECPKGQPMVHKWIMMYQYQGTNQHELVQAAVDRTIYRIFRICLKTLNNVLKFRKIVE